MKINKFLLAALLALLPSCKFGDQEKKVRILGKIKMNVLGQRSDVLTLKDARKILVFKGISKDQDMEYLDADILEIADGSFLATTTIGTAAALVFLSANNEYIGNLSVQGLHLLPLGNLRDGEDAIIDLETLKMVGTSIVPSHDPFGKEIIISQDQLEILKELDGYFEALVKNLDADNDGKMDILTQKEIYMLTMFTVLGGKFGFNAVDPVIDDSAGISINYKLDIVAQRIAEFNNVSIEGPKDSAYTDIKYLGLNRLGHYQSPEFMRPNFFMGTHQVSKPFGKGIYTLKFNGKTYTFNYSNAVSPSRLILPVPTLVAGGDGKVSRVNISYRFPNGAGIEPENLVTRVSVQIANNTSFGRNVVYYGPEMFTHDPNGGARLDPGVNPGWITGIKQLDLNAPLDITGLNNLEVSIHYYDMLGNFYDFQWKK